MSDPTKLPPATPDEFVEALSFALRFKGRRPFPQANSLMARITAEHIAEHIQQCGFLVLKGPGVVAPSTTRHTPAADREPDKP